MEGDIFFMEHLIYSAIGIDDIMDTHATFDVLKGCEGVLYASLYIMDSYEVKSEGFWTIGADVSTGNIIWQGSTIKCGRVQNAVDSPGKFCLTIVHTAVEHRCCCLHVGRCDHIRLHLLWCERDSFALIGRSVITTADQFVDTIGIHMCGILRRCIAICSNGTIPICKRGW